MYHVLGVKTLDEVTEKRKPWRLAGVAEQIRCPMLILHGEKDAQVPAEQAQALYKPRVGREGAEDLHRAGGRPGHCQNDNRLLAHAYIADWLEDVLVRGEKRQGKRVGSEQ